MILSGTGHRPHKLGGYGLDVYQNLVSFATRSLYEYHRYVTPVDRVLSGMALGWDQALCQACITLDIPYTACVPFEDFDCRWPQKLRVYYNHLLDKANAVVVVSQVPALYSFQKRNEYMVDNCDAVLALWDGSEGGTKDCIDYCNKVGRIYHNLWTKYTEFIHSYGYRGY